MPVIKQCSKCGEGYDFSLKACPGCGYQGYRIIDVSDGQPEAEEPMPPPPAQSEAPKNHPPAYHSVPRPAEPRLEAPRNENWRQLIAVFGHIAAGLMLVSFVMVWLQAAFVSASYFKLCEMLIDNLEDALEFGGVRVLAVFIPLIAMVLVGSGALRTTGDRDTGSGPSMLLAGGLVALLAAWQVSDYASRAGGGFLDLSGALGPGFKLFSAMGLAALALGIWGLVAGGAAGQYPESPAQPPRASEPVSRPTPLGVPPAQVPQMLDEREDGSAEGPEPGALPDHLDEEDDRSDAVSLPGQSVRAPSVIPAGMAPYIAIGGVLIAVVVLAAAKIAPERQEAMDEACRSNLRQVALAWTMYRQDYDGSFPLEENWCDGLFPYVNNEMIYKCPRLPKSRSGYAMNSALAGMSERTVSLTADRMVFFDSAGGWNACGGSTDVVFRHDERANAAFADGSAGSIERSSSLLDEMDSMPAPLGAAAPTVDTSDYPDDSLLSDSDTRQLTDSDLQNLTNWELTLARNEIYARHGRPFKNAAIRDYFDAQPSYEPDPGFSEAHLSRLEVRNAATILAFQQRNFGKAATHP